MMYSLKFILVFLIVMYKSIMYYPFVSNLILYLLIIVIGLLALLISIEKRFKKKVFLGIIILLVFVVIAVIMTDSANMFFPIAIILAFKKTEYKTIAKYFFFSLLFFFLLTIFLNIIHVLPSHDGIRYGEYRYSLGFLYPGFVGLYSFFIVLSAYVGFGHERRNMLLCLPFVLLFYHLSLSRAGILGYVCILICAFLPQRIKDSKAFKNIVKFMFPALTILVIIFVRLYSSGIATDLNELFSGRLLHYKVYIDNGLLTSLLGSNPIEGYTIDNYFLYFFFDYGLIGYVIWCFVNYKSINNIKDVKLLCALFAIFIYGLFDSNAVISSINFMISIQLVFLIDGGARKLAGNSEIIDANNKEKGLLY